MSLKSEFVQSFVKGVGKTTGIFAVLGAFAGAWYAGQYFFSVFRNKKSLPGRMGSVVENSDEESEILMMRELRHALNEPMVSSEPSTEDGAIKKMLDRYF
jgi:hypothetical protein